jgi:uncharacterized protein (TIGR03083 family)
MTDDLDLQPVVAAQFQALAGFLSSAPDATWNARSLCTGWRTREVVAHMTMPARFTDDEFMARLERYAYDFTKLSNEIAAQDAELPFDRLVGDLNSDALQRWMPPGGGYRGALNHVVIHSLDITVPIGHTRLASDETMRLILNDLTTGGIHEHFGIDIAGRSIVADDISWKYGSGEVIQGPAEYLAVALCGRTLPEGQLNGSPLLRTEPLQPT